MKRPAAMIVLFGALLAARAAAAGDGPGRVLFEQAESEVQQPAASTKRWSTTRPRTTPSRCPRSVPTSGSATGTWANYERDAGSSSRYAALESAQSQSSRGRAPDRRDGEARKRSARRNAGRRAARDPVARRAVPAGPAYRRARSRGAPSPAETGDRRREAARTTAAPGFGSSVSAVVVAGGVAAADLRQGRTIRDRRCARSNTSLKMWSGST
jgi:hypothetical protein